MPVYIYKQFVYFRHVEMELGNEVFQFSWVGNGNEPNVDVDLPLFSPVVHVIRVKSGVYQQLR